MRDGNDPFKGEEGASTGLDEFLCEYVDGTMDPVVRAAFEEYMRQNPDLYYHVECLRETRSMLCRYGCHLRAPAALQQRLRERLGEELIAEPPVMPLVADRLSWIAGLSSLLLVVCGVVAVSVEMDAKETDAGAHQAVIQVEEVQALTTNGTSTERSRSATTIRHMPGSSLRPASRATSQAVHLRADSFVTEASGLRPSLTVAALP